MNCKMRDGEVQEEKGILKGSYKGVLITILERFDIRIEGSKKERGEF
jgi:hypothetical protein